MKLPIVKYGDPILRAKGKRIEEVDERIRVLAADMLETMQAANGIGLAAQQVGAALQLTVLDISQVEDRPSAMKLNGAKVDPASVMPLVLLNPRLQLDEETDSRQRRLSQFSRHHRRHRSRGFRAGGSGNARGRNGPD